MSGGASQVLANALGRLARYSFAVGVAATAAQSSIFVVNGGQRAVVFNRLKGVEETVRGEVSKILVPLIIGKLRSRNMSIKFCHDPTRLLIPARREHWH